MNGWHTHITDEADQRTIASNFQNIMNILGCNMDDPNFTESSTRWAKWVTEQFRPTELKLTRFDEEPYHGLITLRGHESWSMCSHHWLPVLFTSTVSYIPRNDRVVGASKLARICDHFSKGCCLQETFTRLVADFIMKELDPEGCAVHVEGMHCCMAARGVKTKGSFITRELRGLYLHSAETREEFLSDLRR